jgi:NAD(P)-dependent dehydrogenase (short-subunit alcohol dehydrogenase family)
VGEDVLIPRRALCVETALTGARLVAAGPVDANVAKAALNALTKVVSEQCGPRGVRAVTVSPGPTRTGVWTDVDGMVARLVSARGVEHDAFVTRLVDGLGAATGCLSEPEEIARAIAFAASPNNIAGTELLVDGGIVKNL